MKKFREYIMIAWLLCALIAMIFDKTDKAIFAMTWAIFIQIRIVKEK